MSAIVVDTSALMAILLREPDAERFTSALLEADEVLISAATLLEVTMIATHLTNSAQSVDHLVASLTMTVVPFDSVQLAHARDGFARFGKGRHPAKLNYGDCLAYGLAQSRALPLLWKGDDFGLTDVISALDVRKDT